MPLAAVPRYLGKLKHDTASPALRFGLLLAIWTTRQDQEQQVRVRAAANSHEGSEVAALLAGGMDQAIAALRQRPLRPLSGLWEKNDDQARKSWEQVATLGPDDQARGNALARRQDALARADGMLRFEARALAPFTTGLGNEHPLENGFAFLNPYGLPYLPGSGIKGVLRQAARELDWSPEDVESLFGRTSANGEQDLWRGALSFWDVLPQVEGDRLLVEVMTAHQGHYHQKGETPHESGSPNPILFLTVPPGARLVFHVACDVQRLPRSLADGGRWQELLESAFDHAFEWLGFGAKTAVGYGAMKRDRRAEQEASERRRAQRQEQLRTAERAAMTEAQRQINDFVGRAQARIATTRGRKTRVGEQDYQSAQQLAAAAAAADWTPQERQAAADAIEQWLPQTVAADIKDLRKRLGLRALRGEV